MVYCAFFTRGGFCALGVHLCLESERYVKYPYVNPNGAPFDGPLGDIPLNLAYWYCWYGSVVCGLLSLYSLYCAICKNPSDIPAKVLGPLYFIAAAAALHSCVSPVGLWVIAADASFRTAQIFFLLIDQLVLGSRIRFRVQYIPLAFIILIINTVLRKIQKQMLNLYQFPLLFGVSLVAILLSRSTDCCYAPVSSDDTEVDGNGEHENVVRAEDENT